MGNEIYARSVFVGGSQECIDAVLSHPDLEAIPISPYSRVYGERNSVVLRSMPPGSLCRDRRAVAALD